jgi:hypothetical protein
VARQGGRFRVGTGLPAVVWWVLLLGAALNIGLTYLFSVARLGPHLLLTLALTAFVALRAVSVSSVAAGPPARTAPLRGAGRVAVEEPLSAA